VGAFTAKNRMADPQKAYEAQLNRVNTLAQQQATMRAAGNAVGAAALSAPIASAAAGLDKFGPILTEYNTLVENRSAAASAVTAAQVQLANAKSQFDAADPTQTVFISGARFVDSTETMTRTVIAVGVAAFFLALLIVAMLEVIARGRRERPVAEPVPGEAAAGEAFPHAAPTGRMAPKGSAAAANSGAPSHGIPARAKHH
jgi:hypothetical protein